ncbi:MAG: methyltransferase domain-containing protein [Candidatus Eremiobacteraeota bacterium]|nr:methyltransferase domain-containing protein [Candidatus Eremiobacteraeota bacterium]
MEGPALRAFLRAFHERYPGITAQSMNFLTDERGRTSYQILARAALDSNAGARILDAGCGDGVLLAEIRHSSSRARLAGIDLVFSEIECAKLRIPDATLVVGDITQRLPFDTGEFDVVTAHLVLMLLGALDGTIAEIARITAPGGRLLFVLDDFLNDAPVLMHLMRVALEAADASVPDLWSRATADARIYDGIALERLLAEHGFAQVSTRRLMMRGTLDRESAWRLVRGTYPVGQLEESQLAHARDAVYAESERLNQPMVVMPLKIVAARIEK